MKYSNIVYGTYENDIASYSGYLLDYVDEDKLHCFLTDDDDEDDTGQLFVIDNYDFERLESFTPLTTVISLIDTEGLTKKEEYSVYKIDKDSTYLIVDDYKRVQFYDSKLFTKIKNKLDDNTFNNLANNLKNELNNIKEEMIIKKNIKIYSKIFKKAVNEPNIEEVSLTKTYESCLKKFASINSILFIIIALCPVFWLRTILALITAGISCYFINNILKIKITLNNSYVYLKEYKHLGILNDEMLGKVIRIIFLSNKYLKSNIISNTIRETIISTFLGIGNLYKNYIDVTGKPLSETVENDIFQLIVSIENYLQTLIISNDSSKKSESEKLDKILSDFAINNKGLFDSMTQYNKSIDTLNESKK